MFDINLLDWQRDLTETLTDGTSRHLHVVAPPGSGKTVAALNLIRTVREETPQARVFLVMSTPAIASYITHKAKKSGVGSTVRATARWYRSVTESETEPAHIFGAGKTFILDPSLFARPDASEQFTCVQWNLGIVDDADDLERRRGTQPLVDTTLRTIDDLLFSDYIDRFLSLSRTDDAPFSSPIRTYRHDKTLVEAQHIEYERHVLPYERTEREQNLLETFRKLPQHLPVSDDTKELRRTRWEAQHAGLAAIDMWLRSLRYELEETSTPTPGLVAEPSGGSSSNLSSTDSPSPAVTEWLEQATQRMNAIQQDKRAERFKEFLGGAPNALCCMTSTESATTYIRLTAEEAGRSAFQVRGNEEPGQLERVVADFNDSEGILVVPDSAFPGLDILKADAVVHYDLPFRSGSMQRRRASVLPRDGETLPEYTFRDTSESLPQEDTLLHQYGFLPV